MGTIRAGRLEKCKRLQDAFWLLADGQEHSTREISRSLDRYAINSIIAELRDDERTDNGLTIDRRFHDGAHHYRLQRDAKFYLWRRKLTELAAQEVAS